jgi:hypothetical protein
MDILKYLDVLIGLAVVMLLLSPLVSAITQMWIWLSNMRAGRLQVALKQLILQLNGNPYERFDAVSISGLTPGDTYTLGGVAATVTPAGSLVFRNDIPALLKAGNGTLTFTPPLAPLPPPALTPVVTFLARGPVGDWEITSPPTGADGVAVTKYAFPGPAQFASQSAVTTLPAGASLSAKIASGPLNGTALIVTAGPRITYPPNARPVPVSHDIELTLKDAAGAPVVGQPITLKFERNQSFDAQAPLPKPAALLGEDGAKRIARAVLLHPMIAQPGFSWLRWMKNRSRGEVIEREELTRVLLEFAAHEGAGGAELDGPARDALRQTLVDNGIANPGQALAAIRDAAQQLEKTQPEAASHARLTAAILSAAPSAFVGKINNWFDQAMDRTVAEYRFRSQSITVVAALIVALGIQMDSLDLLKKLATDDKLRNALVEQAKEQQRRFEELTKAAPTDTGSTDTKKKTTPPVKNTTSTDPKGATVLEEIQLAKVRREEIETNLAKLRDPSLAILPEHFIWQPLPKGYLIPARAAQIDKAVKDKTLKRLELVAGASTYAIEPSWAVDPPGDPLAALRDAINNSGAPVTARLEPFEGGVKSADTKTVQPSRDALVLTSRRNPPLQLRQVSGHPETNLLEGELKWACSGWVLLPLSDWFGWSNVCFDYPMLKQSWLGVLVTWMLLSLGAPFWYDALKDMLKLRSTLASKEEAARNERQKDTSKASGETSKTSAAK